MGRISDIVNGIIAWCGRHKVLAGVIGTISLLAICFLFWGRIAPVIVPNPKPKRVYFIGGAKGLDRRGDVVFVHGLNGDYKNTWGDPSSSEFYWPKWLSEKSPDLGVWSLDYDAAASAWLGNAMPIEDRAENLLVEMHAQGIGKRPVIFVCHSLGGIVVKCMMQDGAILKNPEYEEISNQTRGIVFLATPHSGSDKADLLQLAKLYLPTRETKLVEQLKGNSSALRKLNTWYVNNADMLDIKTRVLYETLDIAGAGRIVTESSSNPGMTGVFPTPVDADHLSICKPKNSDSVVVSAVSEFIGKALDGGTHPCDVSLAEFLKAYNAKRGSISLLEGLKLEYKNCQFTWKVFIRETYPQSESSVTSRAAYHVSESMTSKSPEWVLAQFPRNDVGFDKSISKGTRVELSGAFSKDTAGDAIFLKNCRLIRRLEGPQDAK